MKKHDPVEITELAQIEIEVLLYLTRSKTCHSSVVLAADKNMEWTLAEFILDGLNALGLCTYRLGDRQVYNQIRLTDMGWKICGYEQVFHQAHGGLNRPGVIYPAGPGYREGHYSNDMTDFRNQPFRAPKIGAIEKMSLSEHLAAYPEHRYNKGGF